MWIIHIKMQGSPPLQSMASPKFSCRLQIGFKEITTFLKTNFREIFEFDCYKKLQRNIQDLPFYCPCFDSPDSWVFNSSAKFLANLAKNYIFLTQGERELISSWGTWRSGMGLIPSFQQIQFGVILNKPDQSIE